MMADKLYQLVPQTRGRIHSRDFFMGCQMSRTMVMAEDRVLVKFPEQQPELMSTRRVFSLIEFRMLCHLEELEAGPPRV